MPHWSEKTKTLKTTSTTLSSLDQLSSVEYTSPDVYFFWFPFPRTSGDAKTALGNVNKLVDSLSRLNEDSVVCILTTPEDAALLLPYLEEALKFQLWVAVKTASDAYPSEKGKIPRRHVALLVLTRYRGSLNHSKTRVRYAYCPSCAKTTKDYGGKKHTYHKYGTLLSDVWRDIDCNPTSDVSAVTDRIADLFGVENYQRVHLIDLRQCKELRPIGLLADLKVSPNVASRSSLKESRLLNSDSLEALSSIPSNSLDFCFADPPYNLKKKYDKWDDALESVEYFRWCDTWLSELHRVLKPGRTLAVLNIPLWAARHFQFLDSIMHFQAWIAWDGLSFPVRMIMPSHYAIICFSKGTPRVLPGLADRPYNEDTEYLSPLAEGFCLRRTCISRRRAGSDRSVMTDLWHDIHRLKHNSRRVDHPCQLPPLLMRRLYAVFTLPGEMILDCFNGAGTSTLVAEQMKRRYVGIELSSSYHSIAIERHAQIKRGMDPFAKLDVVPVAKNSPVERLPKQRYQVSKKTLQLDVRKIAADLGRLPNRQEVQQLSNFPIEYFDNYFISWGEVCAAARTTGMTENQTLLFEEPESQLNLFTPAEN